MRELLEQIANGKTTFEAEDGHLIEFQTTVKTLIQAYQRGYIGSFGTYQKPLLGENYFYKAKAETITSAGIHWVNASEAAPRYQH